MASENSRTADVQAKTALKSLSLLDERHSEIKQLTEEINSRIVRFQEWVGSLRGRTETSMWLNDPDGNDLLGIHVVLRRAAKKWEVALAWQLDGDPDPDEDYKPLIEASLKTKVYILPFLPNLIDNMVESQAEMASRIRKANATFDDYAVRLKIPAKGDK